jgi:preprotein translocase subunit SecD
VAEAGAELAGQWSVSLRLTQHGLQRFNQLAARCFAKDATCPTGRIAIVLDHVVQSSPQVQTDHFDGPIQISGALSEREAKRLAAEIGR